MKFFITILVLLISLDVYSQGHSDSMLLVNRLCGEIRNAKRVESNYISCYGHKSVLYSQVDSLKKAVTSKVFTNYFTDSSYVLKYYAFLAILRQNDDTAFAQLIAFANDSTKMDFEFAGQNRGTIKFNTLLAAHYLQFLKWKYFYGEWLTNDGETYHFPKRNTKQWKKKQQAFYNFARQNEIDTELIEKTFGR